MSLNGPKKVGGTAIVEQENSLGQSPQRSCAELVAASAALGDVVGQARAHVMNLNVRERVDRCVAERIREV